jgi:O-methyltransferase involved in polyketide biosynthesis
VSGWLDLCAESSLIPQGRFPQGQLPPRSVDWVRSEGDTWDITTSVGSTALFVATARALEAQKPDPLAVDPFAELFCRAVGGPAADVLDGKVPDHRLKADDFGEHCVNFQGARNTLVSAVKA